MILYWKIPHGVWIDYGLVDMDGQPHDDEFTTRFKSMSSRVYGFESSWMALYIGLWQHLDFCTYVSKYVHNAL